MAFFIKKISKRELKEFYRNALKHTTNIVDLPKVFCRLYHFEVIPTSHLTGIKIDFVIDMDTNRIYSPIE